MHPQDPTIELVTIHHASSRMIMLIGICTECGKIVHREDVTPEIYGMRTKGQVRQRAYDLRSKGETPCDCDLNRFFEEAKS